ncbi:MAG: hypothetical protein ABIY70_26215 [Capsulimonas sp.]|uniref:hypothetical protein n=1 Tax=Capsulimonas sp. TaxID=2494211 RepID=UPI003267F3DB
MSAYAIVHLLALVLHMTHSTRAWETAAIAALLMAPSVVIAARWQLRIDQEDAQRAAFITKV